MSRGIGIVGFNVPIDTLGTLNPTIPIPHGSKLQINLSKMGFMSFLSEMISRLLEKDPTDETEITHSKFVSSIVDTLKSGKASSEDILQALRDLGAVVYIGMLSLFTLQLLN